MRPLRAAERPCGSPELSCPPRFLLHVLPPGAAGLCPAEGTQPGPAVAGLSCTLGRDEALPGESEPCLKSRREIMQLQGWHNWENA